MLSSVELEELKNRVSKLLVDSGKRVVVFIDDIDRLDRSEIHAILKLIKLSASFSNTAYVLSFDDDVVAASLGVRYGAGGVEAGRQFLEKIIQVPLHLPDAESIDLRALCFEGVDEVLSENGFELTEEQAEAFVRYFSDGIMPAMHTPRQAKRYINAIRFAVPLLKDEVHIGDQLLLEALRSTYPRLYLTVRENPDVFTGQRVIRAIGDVTKLKEELKTIVEAGLVGLTATERDGALDLLKAIFPRLGGIYGGMSYGADWDKKWDAEKRLTSDDYFRRYFQYSVPARDIPDGLISDLFAALKTNDAERIQAFFDAVSQRKAWSRALDKLFGRIKDGLDVERRRAYAVILAKRASDIPTERGMFASIMSSTSRTAQLIARLVGDLENKDSRLPATEDVLKASTSLPFAADCFRWLSNGGREEGDTSGLNKDQTEQAGGILAARIAKDISDSPDLSRHGLNLGRLLWIWKTYGPVGEMTGFFKARFEAYPEDAVKFLDAFIGRAWGLESGLSHKTSFDRQNFDSVASLMDPQIILAALKHVYGALLDDATFAKCYELKGDQHTACCFVTIHSKVAQEQAAKAAAAKESESGVG